MTLVGAAGQAVAGAVALAPALQVQVVVVVVVVVLPFLPRHRRWVGISNMVAWRKIAADLPVTHFTAFGEDTISFCRGAIHQRCRDVEGMFFFFLLNGCLKNDYIIMINYGMCVCVLLKLN